MKKNTIYCIKKNILFYLVFLINFNLFGNTLTSLKSIYIDQKVNNKNEIYSVKNKLEENVFHLFSHGRPGELLIKGKWLNAKEIVLFLQNNPAFKLQNFSFINIYGCEFAKSKKGLLAVKYIEKKLNVFVAASTNITGREGDWVLEYRNRLISCLTTYSSTLQLVVNDTNVVSSSYTVSANGAYRFELRGGAGGDGSVTKGGKGAITEAIFNLNTGDIITYLIGRGGRGGSIGSKEAGGGGSTGIYVNGTLILVAGGGGGGDNSTNAVGLGATSTTNGSSGTNPSGSPAAGAGGTGGVGGSAGGSGSDGGAGGGINSDGGGTVTRGGKKATSTFALASGGTGNGGNGGRGLTGGGAGGDYFGGAGGGYSGGGASGANGSAGGGGSYVNNSYAGYVNSNILAGDDGAATGGSYANGLNGQVSIEFLKDTDNDGIPDILDLDDDNDGVLDAEESPECFYKEEEFNSGDRTSLLNVSTDLNMYNTSYNIEMSIDGVKTTTSNTRFANSQAVSGVEIYKVEFPKAIELSNITFDYASTYSAFNNAVIKLQASNNNSTWTDLNTGSTYTFNPTPDLDVFQVSQNSGEYIYYRLVGISGLSYSNGYFEAAFNIAQPFTSSKYTKPICNNDIDGDDLNNHLDLDSDGDGCYDSYEARVTNSTNDTLVTDSIVSGPYGGNGLANALQGTDTNSISYNSSYSIVALSTSLNGCTDTDMDGIPDLVDIDDDNDGVLDAEESPECFYIFSEISEINKVTSDLTSLTTAELLLTHDEINTTQARGTLNESATGKVLYEIELSGAVNLSSMNLLFNYSVGRNTTQIQWQGWNGLSWINLTDTLTEVQIVNVLTEKSYAFTKNRGDYTKYRMYGVSGPTYYNRVYEIIPQSIDFTSSKYTKPTCNNDIDGDGLNNHLDLDSDGDGCYDSYEARVTNSTNDTLVTDSIVSGPYGGNGLANALQGTDTNSISYNSSYSPVALSTSLNGCTDTDNDGIPDILDLDDDNDGVLDAEESPECFYIFSEISEINKVTSDLTSLTTAELLLTHDEINTTQARGTLNESATGKVLYEIELSGAVNLSSMNLLFNYSVGRNTTQIQWQGWNGLSWINLTDTLTEVQIVNVLTEKSYAFTKNRGDYTKYRMYGVSGPTYYNRVYEIIPQSIDFTSSKYTKPTCNNDIDGDGLNNHLDLDSDGDGCYDSYEARVTNSTNDTLVTDSIVSGPYGGNGLANALQGTDTNSTNYNSSYSPLALYSSLNGCADTDNDGVTDLVDLDDDNDGILDVEESESCIPTPEYISKLTFNGTSVGSQTENSITTANTSSSWRSSYSAEQFELPIHLEHTYQSKNINSMFGLISVNDPEVTNSWTDYSEKFFTSSNGNVYGYFGGQVWNPTQVQNIGDTFSIDIDTLGMLTVKINNIVKKQYQAEVSNYKMVVTSYSTPHVIENIKISDKNSELICTDKDTDGDNIPDRLDLDSDGDGCPDAIEGDGKFIYSQLVTSTIDGGNIGTVSGPITDNLGNNIDTTQGSDSYGVPDLAGTGQNIGFSLNDTIYSNCEDTDGDSVNNNVDLDDDNDGILDEHEILCINKALTGIATQSSTYSAQGAAYKANDGDTIGDWSNGSVTHTGNPYMQNEWWEIDLGEIIDIDNINIFNRTRCCQSRLSKYHIFVSDVPFTSTSLSATISQPGVLDINERTVALNPSNFDIKRTGRYVRVQLSGSNYLSIAELEVYSCSDIDTDGDSIPDRLDLDSDGDGCPDAVEGGGNYTAVDLDSSNIDGGSTNVIQNLGIIVDSNGVPNTDGVDSTDDSQEIGNSQIYNTETECCTVANSYPSIIDTDGDNIGDACDLDDDNDGILDDEENCGSEFNPFTSLGMARNVSSAGIYHFKLNGKELSTYVDTNGYVQVAIDFGNGTGNLPQSDTLTDTIRGILIPTVLAELTDASELRISYTGSSNPALDAVSTNATLLQRITTNTTLHQGIADNGINNGWTGTNGGVLTINASVTTNAGISLHQNIFHVAGNTDGMHWFPSTSSVKVTHRAGKILADESLQLWVKAPAVALTECNDIDNDGIPNYLDLDSDGDGCPDAVEGGGNYTAVDLDSSNIDGGSTNVIQNLGIIVDSNGVPNTDGVNSTDDFQEIGNSQIYNTGTECCIDANSYPSILDSDGDNIGDACDLDGDNDGVLDEEESCAVPTFVSPPSTGDTIVNFTSKNGVSGTIKSVPGDNGSFASNRPNYSETSDYLTTGIGGGGLNSTFTVLFDTTVSPGSRYNLLSLKTYEDQIITGLDTNGNVVYPVVDSLYLATMSGVNNNVFKGTDNSNRGSVFFSFNTPITSWTSTTIGTGDYIYFRILSLCNELDTDNDGIPNYLDLDSDGDGCPDAIESKTNFISNSDTVPGPYGNNGFADTLENNDSDTARLRDSIVTTYYLALDSNDHSACGIDTLRKTIYEDSSFVMCDTSIIGSSSDSIVSCGATHGTITGGNNCFTYKPDTNFIGLDTACIIICHSSTCDTLPVYITVLPVKDTIADTIPQRDTLTYCNLDLIGSSADSILICGGGSNGNSVITENCINYVSNSNYIGNDTLCYIFCKDSVCDTTIISVLVTDVKDTLALIKILEDSSITLCDTGLNNIMADSVGICDSGNNGASLITGNCITYTVNSGFGGFDTACYIVCNDGVCDTTIVPVFIDPIPNIYCKNETIYLNGSGKFTIDTSFVLDSIVDNNLDSVWLSNSAFTCANLDSNRVVIYAKDSLGQIDSCIVKVTVKDTLVPIIKCKDTTVYLDTNGKVSFDTSYVLTSVTDNCGIDSVWMSDTSATCANDTIKYTIYAKDNSGNIDSCEHQIIVLDTLNPIITCKDTVVYLDTNGKVSFDTSYVLTSVTDNCGIDSVWMSDTSATCANDTIKYTIYAKDNSGNIDSCEHQIIVLDTLNPIITCKDTVVYLDTNGKVSFDTSYVLLSVNDNCGIDSVWMSDTSATCANDTIKYTIYAKDNSGNIDSCMHNIFIKDTLNPIITCKDTVVYLDTNGKVSFDTSYVLLSVTDNCGIDSVWMSDTSATCANDTIKYTIYAKDNSGNIDSCEHQIIVLDTLNPIITCKDTVVYLDTNGKVSFDTSYVLTSVNDNCGIDSVWMSDTSATCANDTIKYTIYAKDNSGNIDSCEHQIIVLDTLNPIITCKDTVVYLDTNGKVSFDTSYVLLSVNDNCGIDSVWMSDTSATCANDTIKYTIYAKDNSGNIDSCEHQIIVLDTLNPIITCKDTTVYLDTNGKVSFDTSYVLLSVNDNCGIDSVWMSDTSATCANDTIKYTIYAKDNSGNIDSCEHQIIVLDTLNPIITCKDTVVYLDTNGKVSFDTSYVLLSVNDNCGIDSVWMSDTSATCANDTIKYTIYAKDNSGNIDSCEHQIIVLDTLNPIITCKDTTVYLDTNGKVSFDTSYVLLSVTDNCGIDSVWMSDTSATCANDTIKYTIYAKDNSGNIDSCEHQIIVLDTLNPIITCKDTTVYLDTNGKVSFDTSYVLTSVTDNCGIDSVWMSDTSATCANDTIKYTIYAKDNSGNIDSCEHQIIVLDTLNPIITCKETIVYLDTNGKVSFDTSYVLLSVNDNCGIDSVWMSDTSATCANDTIKYTIYAKDNSGNIDSCEHQIIVLDTLNPIITCKDTTVYLDTNGKVSFDTSYVLLSVTDNCGIDSVWMSDTSATCANDTIKYTIYAKDNSGNIDSCEHQIIVLDTLNPIITCKDTTVYLDTNGKVSFDTSYVLLSVNDNCGIDSVWMSDTSATCANDTIKYTIYAKDNSGNIDSCEHQIIVLDTLNPIITCKDTVVYLDTNGKVSFDTSYVLLSVTDNCGIDSVWMSDTSATCADDTIKYTIYAKDNSGNIDSCEHQIIVLDTLNPIITCKETIVYLDTNGKVSFDTSYVLLSVTDNCGIDSVWMSDTSATCANDTIKYTIYAKDNSGNIDSCEHQIIVLDTLNPIITCKDTTVYLDTNGKVSFDTSYVLLSVNDNCGIDSVWMSDTSATCANDTIKYTIYAKDNSGNIDSCEHQIIVLDTLNPIITCKDTVVYLDTNGKVSFDTSYVLLSVNDNCGIDSVWMSDTSATCANDTIKYTIYAKDNSGNIDSCEHQIIVLDTLNPIITCKDTVVYLDTNGKVSFDTSYVLTSVNDNCGIDSVWMSDTSATCANDTIKYTIYAKDNSGNIDSCEHQIIVLDTLNPIITCKDTVVYLDTNGKVSFDTSYVLLSVTDNCGIDSVWMSDTSATCANDTIKYTIYAKDNSGNIDSCEHQIIVLDTLNPIITCKDTVVYLDTNGKVSFDTSYVLTSVTDNCGIDSVWMSDTSATCANDTIKYTIYAKDNSGNIDSCMHNIFIKDALNPIITCKDTVVYLDTNGKVSFDTSYVLTSVTDNCGIDSVWMSDTSATCANDTIKYTIYAKDNSGNIDSCEHQIIVLDTLNPIITCKDTVVYLDTNGKVSFDTSYVLTSVTDNCGIDSVWMSDTSATCANDTIKYTIYAKDNSGNIDSCEHQIIVLDTLNPIITCKDTVVYLDTNGKVSFDTSYVLLSVNDNCGIDSVWMSDTSATCANDTIKYTIYAKDNSGNIDSCEHQIIVLDTLNPIITCKDTVVYLDTNGKVSFDTSYVLLSVNDNCGIDSVWMSDTSATCANDTIKYTIYAKDNSGNIDSCEHQIIVLDTLNPIITCKDTTVYLDTNGKVSFDTSYVLLSVTDNCGIDSVWMSDTSATCANDTIKYTIYAKDNSGNIDSCEHQIIVLDTLNPIITCKDTTVYLDTNGKVSFDTSYVLTSVTDNCGIDSVWMSDTSATCANDTIKYTIYAKDNSGNIDSCEHQIIVLDTLNPIITCKETIVYLDTNGKVSFDTSYVLLSVNDNCGIDSVWMSDTSATCANDTIKYTIYAKDNSGNIDSCEHQIIVLDTLNPIITCKDTTVYLDTNGKVSFDTSYVLTSVTDNCGIDSVWMSDTSATCANDTIKYTIYAKDNSGNIDSCEHQIIVLDTLNPIITCKETIVYLDTNGKVSFDTSYVLLSVNDNCGIDSVWMSDTSATCANDTIKYTIYAKDNSGNIDSCEHQIIVLDTLNPIITCKDTVVYLDTNGKVSFDTSYVLLSVNDNCGIDSVWMSDTSATCADDTIKYTIYAKDNSGNIDSCMHNIFIKDTLNPIITCKDTVVYLDTNGKVSFDTSYVLLSVNDNCGIDSVWMSDTSATCANDTIKYTIYAKDNSGNIDSCEHQIIVLDTLNPIITCKDTVVYLDTNGKVSFDTSYVLLSVTDNCGIDSVWMSDTSATCANDTIKYTIYAKDNSGNIDSCEHQIIVLDTLNPIITCKDTVVYLDTNGKVSFDTSYVLLSVNDNCGIDSVWMSDTSATCANDTIKYTIYAKDNSGNIDSCEHQIIVLDTLNPIITCKDTTVYLDTNGKVSFDTSYVLLSVNDNCGIDSVWMSDTSATCANDTIKYTIYAKDNSGNIDSCEHQIIVLDTLNPIITCKDTVVYLDTNGKVSFDTSYVLLSVTDNCGIDSVWMSDTSATCANDTIKYTIYAKDNSGNIDSCEHQIIVLDTLNPIITCKDTTVYLDTNGKVSFDTSYVLLSVNDNCGIDSVWMSDTSATCANDTIKYTIYAKDNSGNIDSCEHQIIVLDTLNPIITCKETIVYLDTNGKVSFDTSYVLLSVNDNCGIDSVWMSDTSATCANDTIKYTIYAKDNSGNIDSCEHQIIVLDTLNPIITCKDTTVYLDTNGKVSFDTSYVLLSVTDNCGIDSVWMSDTSATCANDTIKYTIYAKDNSGNIDSCEHQIIVLDTLNPIITCKDTTVYLDTNGKVSFDTSYVLTSVTDNCGIDSVWMSDTSATCANDTIKYTIYAKDNSGNIDSCEHQIIVLDTLNPIITCKDTVVYLDTNGKVSFDTSYVLTSVTDNCGIDSVWMSDTSATCANDTIKYTIYAKDNSGNIDSCEHQIIVLDTLNPIITCKDTTVYLDTNGKVSFDTSYVLTSVTDNCGIDSVWMSDTSATCANDTIKYTIYAKDNSGNIDSCEHQIIVLDTLNPIITCKDTVVYLDTNGKVSFDTSYVLTSVTDNCGIDSVWMSDTSATCANDTIKYTIYAKDNSGNIDSCEHQIIVLDTLNPIITCKDTTVYLDTNGKVSFDTSYVLTSVTDNCGIDSVWMSDTSATCANDTIKYTIYAKDNSGNIDSCEHQIIVLDTIRPTVSCKNIDIYLNATGSAILTANQIDNGSFDNCGITMTTSKTSFSCSEIGLNQVTLIVTDTYGNVDSCTAIVTVKDTIKPVVICKDVTLYLDLSGNITLLPTDINAASSDACGINTIIIDRASFDCSDVGVNMVTLTVIDNNGNSSSCVSTVTIEDNKFPVIDCPVTQFDRVVNLCEYVIPDYSSLVMRKDNCTDSSGLIYRQIPSAGTIVSAEGNIEVISIFVTDSNGNESFCSFNLELNCDKKIIINEGFSPNGDGINDTWMVEGIEYYPNSSVKIFNRWGNLVYESNGGYKNDWDGSNSEGITFGKKELPIGTYFYIIDLGKKDEEGYTIFKGYIYLQR